MNSRDPGRFHRTVLSVLLAWPKSLLAFPKTRNCFHRVELVTAADHRNGLPCGHRVVLFELGRHVVVAARSKNWLLPGGCSLAK